MKLRVACVVAGFLSFVVSLAAQTSGSSPASAQVPPLIQFSNVASDEGGNTLSGVVSVTFSLYANQRGGEPLWRETQNNVQLDSTGHYSVQLGITKSNGVPTALFTTGEARWLGVRIAEQAEQPRVLLVSVPYALKAGDAATVGGLPPSAFVLAAPSNGTGPAYNPELATGPSVSPATSTDVTTSGGTVNYLPLWDTTSDIISSVIFQSGSGATAKVGINNAAPASTLDVKGNGTIRGPLLILGTLALPATGPATATAGRNSEPQTLTASAFNSGTSTAVNQLFQWQAEPVNNDTSTASGSLNLLFAQGTAKPAETGLNIASNGQITFASGQTFPGTGTGNGTVTSVAAGTGLTASPSPITGSGTLSIATGGVTNAMLAKPSLTVAAGTGLIGGGLVALGGSTAPITLASNTCTAGSALTALPFTCSPFAALGTNTFTGNQTISANILLPNTNSGGTQGVIEFGGTPFIHNYGPSVNNTFVGRYAGNMTTSGANLTAIGYFALDFNTSGSANTASGAYALDNNTLGTGNTASGASSLQGNTTGVGNTANGANSLSNNNGNNNTSVGFDALIANTTGSNNTGLGYNANVGASGLSNATAIGANSVVSEPNALVLGGTGSNAVKVGIGTAMPAYTLDVQGTGNFTGAVNFALTQTFPGVAELGTANTFTGNQTVNGNVTATNLTATGTVTGSVVNATTGFDLGGNLFGWGSPGNYNAFLGFASGNPSSNTGGFNTGTGAQALYSNQGGSYNTATGTGALESNQGGSYNTAAGDFALLPYTSATYNTAIGYAAGNNGYLQATPTGSNNTFVGSYAVYSTADVSNATAIGANAAVGASNALVLGSINGVNQATASVSVGIGTITPAATLDVIDNGLYANGSGKNATISATSSAVNSAVSGVNKSTSGLANGATFVTSSPAGTGVVAINYGSGGSDYAGFFQGNVYISGNLAKSTGTFQIDHPLDPANKYLYHSFVESPDMMNIYNGVATLDARGSVWVTLPNYFEALNQEFRYQLTSIGRPQPSLYVAKEISGNRFRISGGKPGGKVSWQVTGIRHDAYADAHRIKVEVEKSPQEQGRYLHPELFGAPAEQAIGYQVPPAPLKPLIEAESAPEQSLKARPATLR
jgi:hypothetical protein